MSPIHTRTAVAPVILKIACFLLTPRFRSHYLSKDLSDFTPNILIRFSKWSIHFPTIFSIGHEPSLSKLILCPTFWAFPFLLTTLRGGGGGKSGLGRWTWMAWWGTVGRVCIESDKEQSQIRSPIPYSLGMFLLKSLFTGLHQKPHYKLLMCTLPQYEWLPSLRHLSKFFLCKVSFPSFLAKKFLVFTPSIFFSFASKNFLRWPFLHHATYINSHHSQYWKTF